MDSVFAFVAGLVARLGLIFAIPLLFVAVLAVVVVAMRIYEKRMLAQDAQAAPGRVVSWLAFDPEAAYSPGHTWLRETGVRLRVGLDELALRLLPQISSVQVPDAGHSIAAGETLAVLCLGDHEVLIPAPVAGKVTARNAAVQGSASLHGEGGWFVEIESTGQAFRPLRKGEAARAWLVAEAGRLEAIAERELGMAAADGGEVAIPTVNTLPEEKWRALVMSFLQVEPRKATR
jgi:glycine cleavage system H lipoate-binding protein